MCKKPEYRGKQGLVMMKSSKDLDPYLEKMRSH